MMRIRMAVLAVLVVLPTGLLGQAKKLTSAEAKDHIGEQATVCGKIASTRYAATTRGKPTFLNLDKAYPNPVFTVLIWGENREKFGAPEEKYRDKQICVTGRVYLRVHGAPVIADFVERVTLPLCCECESQYTD